MKTAIYVDRVSLHEIKIALLYKLDLVQTFELGNDQLKKTSVLIKVQFL